MSDTIKKLLGEAPERRGPKFLTVEFSDEFGNLVQGIDLEIAKGAPPDTAQKLSDAIRRATLEICARPEFASVVTDATGFS